MALVPFPGPQGTAVSLPPEEDDEASGARMSFLDHLDELRRRIVNACIAIAVGIAATFYWIDSIFNFILAPTRAALPPGVKLIYTQPGEAFSLYITVALIAGAVVASPFIMLQVWLFIAPGLYSNEKRMAIPFVLFTTIGFLAGAAFNHYISFPYLMVFFASFNTPDLAFMPKLEDVFGLYSKMLIGMGLVFQMPAVVFFMAKMKLVTARFLVSNFKYALLIIFIAAAVITPSGDMMTQTIFAAPMIGLYLLSIMIAWIFGPKRLRSADADA
jgi:sec-independent protein translocase protein TatC